MAIRESSSLIVTAITSRHGANTGRALANSICHTVSPSISKVASHVGDRENQRIQIFDADGIFIKQWTGVGYPYGLVITSDQHVWMADGGYDRIVELDQDGKILGAFGEPGHTPGQMAWAHFLAIGPDQTIYLADVLNWRFQVFARVPSTGKMTSYIPSVKVFFWGAIPSTGWASRQSDIPFK